MSKELDEFGQFIIKNSRDRGINYFDKLSKSEWKAPSLKQLQSDLSKFNNDELTIIRRCIISAIDTALHDFLFAIQEASDRDEDIKVFVNEINIAEISDGLHGELFSEDGWFAKYSKYGEKPEIE